MRIKQIALFIVVVLLAACSGETAPAEVASFESLPLGDVERGEQLFTQVINGAPACSACHLLSGSSPAAPPLQGYGEVAGTRVSGQSAEEYTYLGIVQPSDHVVAGYGDIMYNQYGSQLTPQQIADLVAYMLSL